MSPMSETNSHWDKVTQSIETLFDEIEERVRASIREILEAARDSVGSLESSLLAPTPDGENLQFLVSVNPDLEGSDIRVPCGRSIAGYAYSAGQLVATADVAEEMGDRHFADVDKKTGSPTKAYLVVPLTLGEHTLGVLTFHNRPKGKEGEPFPPDAIDLAQEFAAKCATLLRFHQRLSAQMEATRRGLGDSVDFQESGPREESMELLSRLETFSARDRAFVADLLDLLERRRDESLFRDLGLGAVGDE